MYNYKNNKIQILDVRQKCGIDYVHIWSYRYSNISGILLTQKQQIVKSIMLFIKAIR